MKTKLTDADFHHVNQNLRDVRSMLLGLYIGRGFTRPIEDPFGQAERGLLKTVYAIEKYYDQHQGATPCCDAGHNDPRACHETPEERRARRVRMFRMLETRDKRIDERQKDRMTTFQNTIED
jgi:hypothetical protein